MSHFPPHHLLIIITMKAQRAVQPPSHRSSSITDIALLQCVVIS
jgi:hypothetical protein